jgi:hypothetical protein
MSEKMQGQDGQQSRGGAPVGNANALKHGGRSKRCGLVAARLGDKFSQPYVDAMRLRKAIESQVREKHGELTLEQVGMIQTLIRLELSARALEQSQRESPGMPAGDLLKLREAVIKWSLQRDRILSELLGDDHQASSGNDDPWAVVDQAAAQRVRATQRADQATGEDLGDQGSSNATGDELDGSNVEAGSAEQGESGEGSGADRLADDHLADVASGGESGEVSTQAPMSPNIGRGGV